MGKKTEDDLKINEIVLDRALWRTRFGRGYGPVVKETAD